MFAVYEEMTGEIVAAYTDRRRAESHAASLNDSFNAEGLFFRVQECDFVV